MHSREKRKYFTSEQAALAFLLSSGIFIASFFYLANSPKAEVASNYRISINSAGAKELQTLPGVGSKRARRLCECRREQGAFRDLNDIERRLPEWGKKNLARIAPFIKFN